ncbi:signal recognition particle, SRP19 subunit [Mycena alexandri]|uniref:Signal recognition particle, SRP19 subunit n=1 Tax=Mycena alexandri TaxID=1745969 RepID=A0AAD6ST22_9AGAR|nr:signal recognition particle, SRP19 subunit [Mycena alexandri]
MSRRAVVVEEAFDDDTDLPLPSHPLPNTGTSGPLLQEMYISDDELDPPPNQRAGPASPPYTQPTFRPPPPGMNRKNTVTDITPYKNWTCIYPIYIDAKRSYGTGQRRVQRANAVWWPLSKDIADASTALGLAALHEVDKAHPRDWENPGRVRVQWKKDGRLMNPAIRTKKLLLESIAARIQTLKPQFVPVPPFHPTSSPSTSPNPNSNATPSASGKAKQTNSAPAPKTAKSKSTAGSGSTKAKEAKAKTRETPAPPHPHPPLAQRVSPYSPALATGMLVDAVKAGMAAQAQEAAAAAAAPGVPGQGQVGGPGQGAQGAQKGKKKVIRVRG